MVTLRRILLKNFAIVSQTEVLFDSGLTVITGETGAGKSLVVGALALIMGERASSDYLRTGEEQAFIEAEFSGDLGKLRDIFEREELELDGDTITITREIQADGRNRCLINDQRVNLTVLKEIAERFCDLHGQHQHQWLLDTERHVWFLDQFAGCGKAYESYRSAYDRYRKLVAEIGQIERALEKAKEKRELQQFQLDEIERAAIRVDEESELEQEQSRLENTARIQSELSAACSIAESDGGTIEQLSEIVRRLESVAALLPSVQEFLPELKSVKITLSEVTRSLQEIESELEEDPQRLEQVGERLAEIYQLKRKYGGTVEAMLAYRDEITDSLLKNDTDQLNLKDLRKLEPQVRAELLTAADELQRQREKGAKALQKKMVSALTAVGIAKGTLEVEFSDVSDGIEVTADKPTSGGRMLAESGPLAAQFLFSANPGERTKPLAQIASGGELSRVMLALKSLIVGADRVDVLIFDEIDAGIGGEAARLVGQKLKQLSTRQQVIVITHLQQIVSYADHHLKAMKREIKGRTESELIPLTEEERVVELGRMISGGKFSDIERKQAEKLLAEARGVEPAE